MISPNTAQGKDAVCWKTARPPCAARRAAPSFSCRQRGRQRSAPCAVLRKSNRRLSTTAFRWRVWCPLPLTATRRKTFSENGSENGGSPPPASSAPLPRVSWSVCMFRSGPTMPMSSASIADAAGVPRPVGGRTAKPNPIPSGIPFPVSCRVTTMTFRFVPAKRQAAI